jgi:hypothetical protein
MKNQYIYIKNIFVVLILVTLPVTSVYAEKDPNSLLNGVYAQNEIWACSNSPPPFQIGCPDCSTSSVTAAGEITYYGDGTATAEGRTSATEHTNPSVNNSTYSCDWAYQVNEDLTFSYEGECEVLDILAPEGTPPLIVRNQKWYGHIGEDEKMLLVERHDDEIEGLSFDGINNVSELVCGKTGVQIKIKNKDKD